MLLPWSIASVYVCCDGVCCRLQNTGSHGTSGSLRISKELSLVKCRNFACWSSFKKNLTPTSRTSRDKLFYFIVFLFGVWRTVWFRSEILSTLFHLRLKFHLILFVILLCDYDKINTSLPGKYHTNKHFIYMLRYIISSTNILTIWCLTTTIVVVPHR